MRGKKLIPVEPQYFFRSLFHDLPITAQCIFIEALFRINYFANQQLRSTMPCCHAATLL
jgi:hypothetical protein